MAIQCKVVEAHVDECRSALWPTVGARYLITGGAGFLGINLARYLLARGCEVASLDVAEFDYPDCAKNIHIFNGDIRDAQAVERAMDDCQFVVHCAAALPLYNAADIYSTDVDGTRNVLQSALDHGVARMVHISSTAVYGIPDHHRCVRTTGCMASGRMVKPK